MRVVLDTNVLISGVFFAGLPGQIVAAWREGRIQPVLSPEILDEYQRVGRALGEDFPGVDLDPFLLLLTAQAEIIDAPALRQPVSADPDDDKFLACALAAGVTIVISGDKDLVEQSGWRDIQILRPRQFVEEFLS